jgi:hypothetical protein
MLLGTGKKQDAWRIKEQRTSVGANDRQGSSSEYVKITGRLIEVRREATLPSGIKHPGRQRESFEERGQAIHNDTIRYINGSK